MPRPANPYDDFEIMGSTDPNNFVPAIAAGNNVLRTEGGPRAVVAAPGSEAERQALDYTFGARLNRARERAQQVASRRGTRTPRPTSVTPRNRRQRAQGAVRQARRRVANVAERAANRLRGGRRGRR